MEFRAFRYILKIAETGTISAAAAKLYVSQPSLSQLLTGIERKLGTPLFDRSSSPLQPTVAGELYLRTARQILALDEEFHQRIDDMLHLASGRVVIGITPFRSAYLLAAFLPSFQKKYPGIHIGLRESTTMQIEEYARHGEVDYAISLLPVEEKAFLVTPLFDEELLLAIPPMHPIAKEYSRNPGDADPAEMPALPLAAFREAPFIQMQSEQKLHERLMALCKDSGFTPKIQMETSSMEAAQALAGAGLGCAILPDALIRGSHPNRPPAYVAIEGHPHRTAVLLTKKGRYQSNAARAFASSLQDFCENLAV